MPKRAKNLKRKKKRLQTLAPASVNSLRVGPLVTPAAADVPLLTLAPEDLRLTTPGDVLGLRLPGRAPPYCCPLGLETPLDCFTGGGCLSVTVL